MLWNNIRGTFPEIPYIKDYEKAKLVNLPSSWVAQPPLILDMISTYTDFGVRGNVNAFTDANLILMTTKWPLWTWKWHPNHRYWTQVDIWNDLWDTIRFISECWPPPPPPPPPPPATFYFASLTTKFNLHINEQYLPRSVWFEGGKSLKSSYK